MMPLASYRGVATRPAVSSSGHATAPPSQYLATQAARRLNDAMVYLDGPQVYSCSICRTHLTSHDDIVSKSFHGKHGRAYLLDNAVNVVVGKAEDRWLLTGLHTVCDVSCKRCRKVVGWTYIRAYERSQKYKEGRFILEKIFLYMETSGFYSIDPPAGERGDRWRKRSLSWGDEKTMVYEYDDGED